MSDFICLCLLVISEVFHVSCVDCVTIVNLFFSVIIMNPNPLAFLQILNGYNRPEKAILVKVTLNIPTRDAVAESWSG